MNDTIGVSDLIKERDQLTMELHRARLSLDEMRGAVLLCKHEMTNRGLEWSAIVREALDKALSSNKPKSL